MMRWYIVDGIDGSGKTTVARSMRRYFEERGETVMLQVHPSERWLGRRARVCLQEEGRAMYLLSTIFFILDALVSLSKMRRWRERYDRIIFVRYVLAAAYLPDRLVPFGYRFLTKLLPMTENKLLVDIDPSMALSGSRPGRTGKRCSRTWPAWRGQGKACCAFQGTDGQYWITTGPRKRCGGPFMQSSQNGTWIDRDRSRSPEHYGPCG